MPMHVEEEQLWNSLQLGAYTPFTLVSTVIYFNMKYFKLLVLIQFKVIFMQF